jgi:S1-C subfamily serine protease
LVQPETASDKRVVAIGNPHGITNSLSQGIVSSVKWDESGGYHCIWFDAAISPGSSGGPVLDMEGNVIGVASGSIEEESAQNLNCAISSIRLKQLLDNADTSTSVNTIAGLSAALLPTGAANSSLDHWLNTQSNVRHNSSCRYYKNTKQGRPCRENEGRACKVCGG